MYVAATGAPRGKWLILLRLYCLQIRLVGRRPNFGVKLMRPGFGPAAELPALLQAQWRHGGRCSPLGSANVIGGNRRAASASARATGRTAYTKDVVRTG